MSDEKLKEQGPGQSQTPDSAAERRAAHVAALEEERHGYERRGLADRVKLVDAELAKFKCDVKGRRTKPEADEA